MLPTIEENPGETLYREYFYPCKTFELKSKSGITRQFVEFSEATDYGADLQRDGKKPEMALKNVVRRLLVEKDNSFFFEKNDDGVNTQVLIDGSYYWLKGEDISKRWRDHYWTKTKKPLVGFKTINKDGTPVLPNKMEATIVYEVGKLLSYNEKEMISGLKGYYFSPQLQKALQYSNEDTETYLAVAWGLVFIKNSWDDIGAQNLMLVKRLTKKDIKLLDQKGEKPQAFWDGNSWASNNDDFCYEYLI